MNDDRKIAASEKVCRNCRYLSCTRGHDLRCADPASADFDRQIAPRGSCGRFQIGFEAARRLAAEQCGDIQADAWNMTMQRRQHPHPANA